MNPENSQVPKQSRTPGAVREVIVVQQTMDPTRPKSNFADANIFRSGEGIFILDKNPIWMTPAPDWPLKRKIRADKHIGFLP